MCLEPRRYQVEMAKVASACNTLLIAPTGSGKTKVIAMVVDALWRKKPSAKVSLPFLPLFSASTLIEILSQPDP